MKKPGAGARRLRSMLARLPEPWTVDRFCDEMIAASYAETTTVRSVRNFLEGETGRKGKPSRQVRSDITTFLRERLNITLPDTFFDEDPSFIRHTDEFIERQRRYVGVSDSYVGDYLIHMLQASHAANPSPNAEIRSQELSISRDTGDTFGFCLKHWMPDQPTYNGFVIGAQRCLQLVGFPDRKDNVGYFWLGVDPADIGLKCVKMFGFTASAVSNPKSPVPRGVARRVVVTPAGEGNLTSDARNWLLGGGGRKGTNAGMVVELERLDDHDV